ncbi:MAG: MaoC/PaaZ C-terminal domain-containing protein [Planctomycetota bacterium]
MEAIASVVPLRIEDLREGQTYSEKFEFSEKGLQAFINLSGDRAPAHVDDSHAKGMGYGGRIVHGLFVCMPYSRILGMFLPGGNTVIHQMQFDALAPVYVGDTVSYQVKIVRISVGAKTVVLELSAVRQDGGMVNRGRVTCTFRK